MKSVSDEPLLILASESPRRRYLLEQAGLTFTVIPSDLDESAVRCSAPSQLVKTLAEAKAECISKKYPDSWIVGADTIVLMEGKVLGKPASRSEARTMIQQLSGRTHRVLTGYCICCQAKKRRISDVTTTEVLFKKLTDDEIEWYIHTKEPFDKAGAYAIQGLGTFLVKSINGSYTNVVGLPVCEVIEILIKEGVIRIKDGNRE